MIQIKEVFVGSGAFWLHEGLMERDAWLEDNIGIDNYLLTFEDKLSDVAIWSFINDDDATLYTLTWKLNEYNKPEVDR